MRPPCGIIPAYAGSTITKPSNVLRGGDHPRVCGEHFPRGPCTVRGLGSSPRMRGAQGAQARCIHRPGIIPAYAGSTMNIVSTDAGVEDHPRVCGEHSLVFTCSPRQLGSSPRMRGARSAARSSATTRRIIPAYAGSTSWPSVSSCCLTDHPRVCGEHATTAHPTKARRGSSPRMRGAPRYSPSRHRYRRDHPRVCGEHMETRTRR